MIPGLGSIVDRVAGLFGKTYLLAGFFPVLVLAAVSLLAGYDSSAWVHGRVEEFRGLDAGRQALASGALLLAVATLGFVYWSANPWWRAVLQGDVLPRRVREWMVRDQRTRLAGLEQEIDACEARLHAFRLAHPATVEEAPEPAPSDTPPAPARSLAERLRDVVRGRRAPPPALPAEPADDAAAAEPTPWIDRLASARVEGAASEAEPGSPSPEMVRTYEALKACIRSLQPVEAEVLDEFCTRLEGELAAGPVPGGSALDRIHTGFVGLADIARARAEDDRNRALSARRIRFPTDLAAVGPTRLANAAGLYRDAALARYRLDPEVFWLHLQRAASADDQFRPILEEARLKLEVSVAMAMACALVSSWTLVLALAGHSLPVLLLTGVAFPAGAILFYHASVTNLRVYGQAVTATVDLFRFEVLKALRVPLPDDSEAERRLWEALTLSNQLLDEHRLAYAHP